jgi:hypothetical protein
MTLQIELTTQEQERLRTLETNTGRSQDELIRLALTKLLTQEAEVIQPYAKLSDEERLARLRAAKGMWADHTDLPDDLHAWRKAQ